MCGLAGYFGSSLNEYTADFVLNNMGNMLFHRGPDSQGLWLDTKTQIGLVHQRLAIQDLSKEGTQPMHSISGRYVIVYNGEIYNFRDLRNQLTKLGITFRGNSDTEVLLACINEWGVKKTLKRCTGMFAFALWDKKLKLLTLARDRMGEKPLYYGWQGKSFLFGSELKSLKKHPDFKSEICRDSLCLLLRYSTISAPYSIYKNIYKLPPASILTLDTKTKKTYIENYWSLEQTCIKGVNFSFRGSVPEAIIKLDEILSKSVKDQMIADVPIGAFLSGGIDSSLISSIMQKHSSKKIKTFSIGFEDNNYDEAKFAKEVARQIGTEHNELYVKPRDVMDIIPHLPLIYDEPFADSSQLPSCLLSKMTQKQVKVALSGDGGDELFGGYNRHFWVKKIWSKIKFFPNLLRFVSSNTINGISTNTWDVIYKMLLTAIPPIPNISQPGKKLHKLATILNANSEKEIYKSLISHWDIPEKIILNADEHKTYQMMSDKWPQLNDIESQMMLVDGMTYLPDDILTKVDRASMSASLELRTPMLNHHLVEFAWKLPLNMKINNGQGKWILRELLKKYIPKNLIDRPKMGFSVPISEWLRGPLRDWAESLLDENKLKKQGFFNPPAIKHKWNQHLSQQNDWHHHLWDVLMFQTWLEQERK